MRGWPRCCGRPRCGRRRREWAKAQAADGTISHRADLSPYPQSVPDLTWRLTGENVGHTGSALAGGPALLTVLDNAFYESPAHQANVLGRYTHIAVGVTDDGTDLYVTVAFVDWQGASVPGERLPSSDLHDTEAALDSVRGVDGGVRLVASVTDPDGDPTLHVTVDGQPTVVTPNVLRPDLAAQPSVRPDRLNGLNRLVESGPGPVNVCVDSPALGFGRGVNLGCRVVEVPQGWDGLVGSGATARTVAYRASAMLPGNGTPFTLPETLEAEARSEKATADDERSGGSSTGDGRAEASTTTADEINAGPPTTSADASSKRSDGDEPGPSDGAPGGSATTARSAPTPSVTGPSSPTSSTAAAPSSSSSPRSSSSSTSTAPSSTTTLDADDEAAPAGSLPPRVWAARYPATLQRYPNARNAEPFLAHGDPLGRLHWRTPQGRSVVARPSGGALPPGRPAVDVGDVDGDGDDDLMVVVRVDEGWALTGFRDADPAQPWLPQPLEAFSRMSDVRVAVTGEIGPAPGGEPATTGGDQGVDGGSPATETASGAAGAGEAALPRSAERRLVVSGRRRDSRSVVAVGGGAPTAVAVGPDGAKGAGHPRGRCGPPGGHRMDRRGRRWPLGPRGRRWARPGQRRTGAGRPHPREGVPRFAALPNGDALRHPERLAHRPRTPLKARRRSVLGRVEQPHELHELAGGVAEDVVVRGVTDLLEVVAHVLHRVAWGEPSLGEADEIPGDVAAGHGEHLAGHGHVLVGQPGHGG